MKRTLLLGLVLAAGVSNVALANADLAKAKNCMAVSYTHLTLPTKA